MLERKVIRSFKDAETEEVLRRRFSRKRPRDIPGTAFRKMRLIDGAGDLEDLRIPPAKRLEALQKQRKGQYSLRINDQWRICFAWKDGDAHDVEITDYH